MLWLSGAHVIELTADRFWLVADGGVTPFEGDMDAYRSLLLAGAKKASKGPKETPAVEVEVVQAAPPAPPIDKREQRKKAAEQRQAMAPLRKQVQRMEKNIAKFQAEKATTTPTG